MAYKCPNCDKTIYDRRKPTCEFCSQSIPEELLFSDQQLAKLDDVLEREEVKRKENLDRQNPGVFPNSRRGYQSTGSHERPLASRGLKTKIILVLVVLTFLGYYVKTFLQHHSFFAKEGPKPGNAVRHSQDKHKRYQKIQDQWNNIRIGMQVNQVQKILGNPDTFEDVKNSSSVVTGYSLGYPLVSHVPFDRRLSIESSSPEVKRILRVYLDLTGTVYKIDQWKPTPERD